MQTTAVEVMYRFTNF